MVSERIKRNLINLGLWNPFVACFNFILGGRNVWRLNEYRRSRFLRNSRHTEPLVPKRELEIFFHSLMPVNTEFELVRIGGMGDGSYLLPNVLDSIKYVFSPGVAGTASFEQEMVNRGIPCFLADYSVENAPMAGLKVDFEKRYIGTENNDVFMTLSSWLQMKNVNSSDLLLQMDIEGAEWEVLQTLSRETLNQFRVMIIEFHNLHFLIFRNTFEQIRKIFEFLLRDFYLVHFHPNNNDGIQKLNGVLVAPTVEITFLRKDSCKNVSDAKLLTHPLDIQNSSWKRKIFAEQILKVPERRE